MQKQYDELEDIEKELSKKFAPKILDNIPLWESYCRLGMYDRAQRLATCGTFLTFRLPVDGSESPALHSANFCKDRLCGMCAWRRSMKVFGQVSQVMDLLESDYRFVFLTLTVRNCSAEDLHFTVDQLHRAFNLFVKYKAVKAAFKGYFKALEITRNRENVPALEYHPHLHIIFAVNNGYFHGLNYLSQLRISQLWASAAGLDYTPVVFIEKVVKQPDRKTGDLSFSHAVAEVAKYTVKPFEVLQGSYREIDRVVLTFLDAISSRRLCSFGGCFRQAARQLKLDDLTDGDLVLTGNKIRADLSYIIVTYQWRIGAGYVLTGSAPLQHKNE